MPCCCGRCRTRTAIASSRCASQAPRIGVANAGVSVKEIQDYRAQTPSLDTIVEYHQMSFNLLGRGDALRVQTGVVSPEFFDVLGVKPILGRTFRGDDDSPVGLARDPRDPPTHLTHATSRMVQCPASS